MTTPPIIKAEFKGQRKFDELYITADALTRILGVNRNTLQNWLRDGSIPTPSAQAGRTLLWEREPLRPFIEGRLAYQKARDDMRAAVAASEPAGLPSPSTRDTEGEGDGEPVGDVSSLPSWLTA